MTAVTFLISAVVAIGPPQQVNGLSTYDIGVADGAGPATIVNGKTDSVGSLNIFSILLT